MGCRKLWLVVETLLVVAAAAAAETPAATADAPATPCKDKCGNVSIPYPFGVGSAVCFREGFELFCNETAAPAPKLCLDAAGNIEVSEIFLSEAQLRIKAWMGVDCYDSSGARTVNSPQWISLGAPQLSPFVFSHTKNKFTAVGCDVIALITPGTAEGASTLRSLGGCFSIFTVPDDVADGECSGIGCCQVSIPRGIKKFTTAITSSRNHSKCRTINVSSCGYDFLVEEGAYHFSTADLTGAEFSRTAMPVMLDWSIGRNSCAKIRGDGGGPADRDNYACRSKHSDCLDAPGGVGYICNCSAGYDGNPYLDDGCTDIDECSDLEKYCGGASAICENKPGSYTCACPPGTASKDPTKQDCVPLPSAAAGGTPPAVKLGVGEFSVPSCSISRERRSLICSCDSRPGCRFPVIDHGGFMDILGIPAETAAATQAQVLPAERGPLPATAHVVSQGIIFLHVQDIHRRRAHRGHGTVYKGVLEDGREVAVKRSRTVDERQSKEFAREMLILSQINHRNVVKLLGCCLEVEVPMLVYEFVRNGTLFDHIHGKQHHQRRRVGSLGERLRVAAEAAEALAYLHSSASPPVLHGDVKSCNILLDDNFAAKVSDFGASVLAPLDGEQLATVVQGTCGYLDPEYLVSGRLTVKSDVYSFGVVLAELFTGKKAFRFDGPEEEKSLARSFVAAVGDDRLAQIVEAELVLDGGAMELVGEVAELASRCLRMKGEERPDMREVAGILRGLTAPSEMTRFPWAARNAGETERLLGDASDGCSRDATTISVTYTAYPTVT